MDNPLISVIVPMKNASAFIERCIESVISQSYENWQLVVVNDGSSDGCDRIAKLYSQKYPGVIILLNSLRPGVVQARCVGVEYSLGDYILFLDADDYLPNNALELLVVKACQCGADVVLGSYSLVSLLPVFRQKDIKNKKEIDTPISMLKYCLKYGECFLPVKLYKSTWFKQNFFVITGITYQEDLVALTKMLPLARSVSYVDDIVYYYVRHGSNSTCGSYKKHFSSIINVTDFLYTCYHVDAYRDIRFYLLNQIFKNLLLLSRECSDRSVFVSLFSWSLDDVMREAKEEWVAKTYAYRYFLYYSVSPALARVADFMYVKTRKFISCLKNLIIMS